MSLLLNVKTLLDVVMFVTAIFEYWSKAELSFLTTKTMHMMHNNYCT